MVPPSCLWLCRNPESSPSPNMTTSRLSWTSLSSGAWVWVHSGNYERVSSTTVPQFERKSPQWTCVFFVFHREWDGRGAKTFADSTAPTSACATRRPAAAPRWAAGTCRSTKLISLWSRRRTMCQAAAGASPVTTGRSLQKQPPRRRNSSCGSDGTTHRSSVPLQALPGLKTLLC